MSPEVAAKLSPVGVEALRAALDVFKRAGYSDDLALAVLIPMFIGGAVARGWTRADVEREVAHALEGGETAKTILTNKGRPA